MTTKEIEELIGLSKHTMCFYEKEGLISPRRNENGFREYSKEDLEILLTIKFLRNLDLPLDDVKAILNGNIDAKECIRKNQVHLEKQISLLEEAREKSELFIDHEWPLIPALAKINQITDQALLGYTKTTRTVSLGRRLTRKNALIHMLCLALFSYMIGLIIASIIVLDNHLLFTTTLLISGTLLLNLFIALDLHVFNMWLRIPMGSSMNASIEFNDHGLRCHQFSGYLDNWKYFYDVLLHGELAHMKTYRYEDITHLSLHVSKRYESIGSPLAGMIYALDYRFDFKDGTHFSYYWPMTINDDSRYIGCILKNKVKEIDDPDTILYALENGINIDDYMKSLSQEDET